MKSHLRKFQIALSICVMLSFLLVRPGVAATPVVIDHFDTGTQLINISWPGSGPHLTDFSWATGSMLGGERDVLSEVWSNNPANSSTQPYQVDIANHALNISSGTDLLFKTEIQWDGSSDSPKSVINPVGLGGVDITAGGQDRFLFGLPSSDVGGTFTIRLYTSATACSELVSDFPGNVNTYNQAVVEIPYALFDTDATICTGVFSSLATRTNIGAISLTIATSITSPSLDMSMDLMDEDSSPYQDFGDLPTNGTTTFYDRFKTSGALAEAYHISSAVKLGAGISLETSKPGGGADVTAKADTFDDGVTPSGLPWSAGTGTGQVKVIVTGCPTTNCYLTAFIDWNQNGSFWKTGATPDWAPGERILSNALVVNGTNTISFDIPSIAQTTGSFANKVFYARFRLTEEPMAQGTAYGAAFSGEVEDYRWTFGVTAVKVERLNASSPAAPLQPILPFAAAVVIAAGAGVVGLVRRRKQA